MNDEKLRTPFEDPSKPPSKHAQVLKPGDKVQITRGPGRGWTGTLRSQGRENGFWLVRMDHEELCLSVHPASELRLLTK